MKQYLTLHILTTRQEVKIPLEQKIILGRCADSDEAFCIDLSPFYAYQLGVSRRHVMLVVQEDEQILAFDLSSRNGSFINGERLSSDEGLLLVDGDELRLGSLALRVYTTSEIPFAELQTRPLEFDDQTVENPRDTLSAARIEPSHEEKWYG